MRIHGATNNYGPHDLRSIDWNEMVGEECTVDFDVVVVVSGRWRKADYVTL